MRHRAKGGRGLWLSLSGQGVARDVATASDQAGLAELQTVPTTAGTFAE